MSFKRPEYLSRVLESLRAQVHCDIEDRTVVLWQDGCINPVSNRARATATEIRNCVTPFQESFPGKPVMESPINLGVARNFERAERFAFEEMKVEAAIFLEDDLVLGQNYIPILDTLIASFAADERVGYVAAYGDHRKSIEDQRKNQQKLILLYHNWGFALYRRQWLRMRDRVLEYLDLIEKCDYVDRNHAEISKLFASWGFRPPASSQDSAKTVICCMDDVIKINTYACNAVYIGEHGIHMNPGVFAERGYDKTALYPEKVSEFEPLDSRLYDALLKEQRDWAQKSPALKIGVQRAASQPEATSDKVSSGKASSGDHPDERVRSGHVEKKALSSAFETCAMEDSTSRNIVQISHEAAPPLHYYARNWVPDLIDALYRTLLLRKPDSGGFESYIKHYVKQLSQGTSCADVILAFLSSQEFVDNLPKFITRYYLDSPKNKNDKFTLDHSQNGEIDLLIRLIVNAAAKSRFVVDVGAAGRARSNSYDLLRVFRWKGLLIEANPSLIPRMEQEFTGLDIQIVNAAVSDREGDGVLYIGVNNDVSSLAADNTRGWGEIREEVPVKIRMLSAILQTYGVPVDFDLLSLDIEGEDIRVFNEIVQKGYRPRWVIIEASAGATESLHGLPFSDLVRQNYQIAAKTKVNLILSESQERGSIEHKTFGNSGNVGDQNVHPRV